MPLQSRLSSVKVALDCRTDPRTVAPKAPMALWDRSIFVTVVLCSRPTPRAVIPFSPKRMLSRRSSVNILVFCCKTLPRQVNSSSPKILKERSSIVSASITWCCSLEAVRTVCGYPVKRYICVKIRNFTNTFSSTTVTYYSRLERSTGLVQQEFDILLEIRALYGVSSTRIRHNTRD